MGAGLQANRHAVVEAARGDIIPRSMASTAIAFSHPVRIYWEDTDAGGIVYYANYLKFFERARTEWLRSLGIAQEKMRDESGSIFVVTDLTLRYVQAARLDDELIITVARAASDRVTFTLAQSALRAGSLLADGRLTLACVEAATLRPQRLPSFILDALASHPAQP